MTKEQKTLFGAAVIQLRKACKRLHWKFKLSPDVDKRYELISSELFAGVGFEIDGIEYFLSKRRPAYNTFYASVIVQTPETREEQATEEEKQLRPSPLNSAKEAVGPILNAHWKTWYYWVMEELQFDQEAEDYKNEENKS